MFEINIYKEAAKQRLRFRTSRGDITVEDLMLLPLSSGNNDDLSISKQKVQVAKEIKELEEEIALMDEGTESRSISSSRLNRLKLALAIIDDIADTKKTEAEERQALAERTALLKQYNDILAAKREQELVNLSTEELEKRIKALTQE